MNSISNSKGSAIILTILMAAVIITVGLGFNWLVKEHLSASEGLKRKAEAILKARSVCDTLGYLLINGQMRQRELTLSGTQEISGLISLPLNGKKISLFKDDLFVQIQDSNGLLSLANMNTGALERLLQRVGGLDYESAAGVTASLLDWIDPDDLTRINGAESFFYKWAGKPYSARNYPIQFKEELAWIKGLGKPLYQKIAPFITILPVTGFNPNTAADQMLAAYMDLPEENLKALRDSLAQKPISSDAELFALTGRRIGISEEGVNFFPSPFLEVTIIVGRPKSLYTIRAGLDIRQNRISPYSVIYWKEE